MKYEQIQNTKQEAINLWNAGADQYNQWDSLSRDEQDELFARAILQAASADQVCKHCSGIGSYVGSNDGCDDESCDHCDGTGKVRMNSNMNSNMNRSQAASTAPADRNAIQMTLVMRNGEPHAAYPRRKQAEVYASGFSGNEGLELIDGAFNSAAPVSSAQPVAVQENPASSADYKNGWNSALDHASRVMTATAEHALDDQPRFWREAASLLLTLQDKRESAQPVAGVPEGWREFLESCATFAGYQVNGNSLSMKAKELLAAAPSLPDDGGAK